MAAAPTGLADLGSLVSGRDRTFAELPLEDKNALSHRGRALARFAAWLKDNRPAQG